MHYTFSSCSEMTWPKVKTWGRTILTLCYYVLRNKSPLGQCSATDFPKKKSKIRKTKSTFISLVSFRNILSWHCRSRCCLGNVRSCYVLCQQLGFIKNCLNSWQICINTQTGSCECVCVVLFSPLCQSGWLIITGNSDTLNFIFWKQGSICCLL